MFGVFVSTHIANDKFLRLRGIGDEYGLSALARQFRCLFVFFQRRALQKFFLRYKRKVLIFILSRVAKLVNIFTKNRNTALLIEIIDVLLAINMRKGVEIN